jgi:hypothetical protein
MKSKPLQSCRWPSRRTGSGDLYPLQDMTSHSPIRFPQYRRADRFMHAGGGCNGRSICSGGQATAFAAE